MADYIPREDPEAIAQGRTRVNYAQANLVALGLTAGDVSPLANALDEFEAGYDQHVNLQAQARAGRENKDGLRKTWETHDRAFNGLMQARLSVTGEQKAAMYLKVYDTTKTASKSPVSHPVGEADTSQKLKHTISFRDSETPDSKAKPKGIFGCEILYKIGEDAPVDDSQCQSAGIDTNTPYLMNFEGKDAGKTVYYLLRWVSNTGEKSALSPLFSATITN
jgi:hypothetical protein